jgi:hypothetical protein
MSQVQDATVGFRTVRYPGTTSAGVNANLTRPADTTPYSPGDVISAVTTNDHFTFGAASNDGSKRVGRAIGPGTLSVNLARLFSSANQATKLDAELWLFCQDIAEVADNGAFAPTDAEMLTLVGIIDFPFTAWKVGNATSGAGGNAVCEIRNLDFPIARSKDGRLYGQLVARNAYTPVASEIFTVELVCTTD